MTAKQVKRRLSIFAGQETTGTKMYTSYEKRTSEGGRLAVNPAGMQRLRFCVRSLTRCQPVRAHRVEDPRWVYQRPH